MFFVNFFPDLLYFCCLMCLSFSFFSDFKLGLVFQLVFLFCSGKRHCLLSVKKNSALKPVTITAAKRMGWKDGTALRRRHPKCHTSPLSLRHSSLTTTCRTLTLTPIAARKQGILHMCIPKGTTTSQTLAIIL